MPPLNRKKIYVANGAYHIYNRGVEKRSIFIDAADYRFFRRTCIELISDPEVMVKKYESQKFGYKKLNKFILRKNYFGRVKISAQTLMPNHFHLQLIQTDQDAMTSFMKSLIGRYVIYFNKKHGRVGHLFQDIYKATYLKTDRDILYNSRYIHRNPLALTNDLSKYPWSTYPHYIGKRSMNWVYSKKVKESFKAEAARKGYTSYADFVEDQHE